MKVAVFNFLALQVVVWSIVFSPGNQKDKAQVNHASISDTWKVEKVAEPQSRNFIMHYPTFNKLTLNEDGSYVRLDQEDKTEKGVWSINSTKSILILNNGRKELKYDIVQAPGPNTKSFVIMEIVRDSNPEQNIKYELTRM